MNGSFGGFSISEIKSVNFKVALCALCMRVLHGDLQVIRGDFPYCIVLFFLGKAVNRLPIIPAIFNNYCQGVFAFIQSC